MQDTCILQRQQKIPKLSTMECENDGYQSHALTKESFVKSYSNFMESPSENVLLA
jgi:hypothetical protein